GAAAAGPKPPRRAAHPGRRLAGERTRQDLARAARARGALPRDPPRDRGRLPRAGAREDADRPAHSLGRPPLLGIQPVEDFHRARLASGADGSSSASVPKACLLLPSEPAHASRAVEECASSTRAATPPPPSP